MTARRYTFDPDVVTVKQGDRVVLTIAVPITTMASRPLPSASTSGSRRSSHHDPGRFLEGSAFREVYQSGRCTCLR